MAQMNTGRMVVGGIAAGVLMNAIDFVVNGMWLGPRWEAESNALNAGLMARAGSMSMIGWIVYDLLLGIAIAWLYAAIRPRFGPGPRTAVLAGLAAWFVSHLAFTSYAFNALYSWGVVGLSTIGALVATLAGAYVAGTVYKEAE